MRSLTGFQEKEMKKRLSPANAIIFDKQRKHAVKLGKAMTLVPFWSQIYAGLLSLRIPN